MELLFHRIHVCVKSMKYSRSAVWLFSFCFHRESRTLFTEPSTTELKTTAHRARDHQMSAGSHNLSAPVVLEKLALVCCKILQTFQRGQHWPYMQYVVLRLVVTHIVFHSAWSLYHFQRIALGGEELFLNHLHNYAGDTRSRNLHEKFDASQGRWHYYGHRQCSVT